MIFHKIISPSDAANHTSSIELIFPIFFYQLSLVIFVAEFDIYETLLL